MLIVAPWEPFWIQPLPDWTLEQLTDELSYWEKRLADLEGRSSKSVGAAMQQIAFIESIHNIKRELKRREVCALRNWDADGRDVE